MNAIKLFCLPYAGGLSGFFAKWQKFTDESIDVIPVELAGRGVRAREPFYQDFSHAVDDICEKIKTSIHDRPYALFGHSMGAMLEYELYYRLKHYECPLPLHIFFSGRRAIHEPVDGVIRHKLPDDVFMQELIDFGGTTRDVFNNKQLRDLFLPILRADFKLVETYQYIPKDDKISCDITILGGRKDVTTSEKLLHSWKHHAGKNCDVHIFEGGHFFINDDFENCIETINDILSAKVKLGLSV